MSCHVAVANREHYSGAFSSAVTAQKINHRGKSKIWKYKIRSPRMSLRDAADTNTEAHFITTDSARKSFTH